MTIYLSNWSLAACTIRKLKINMINSTVTKTFVFEREDTHQSNICPFEIQRKAQEVHIEEIFNNYCPPLKNRILVYDPISQKFQHISTCGQWTGSLSQRLLEPSIILVRYVSKELLNIDHDLSIVGQSEQISERQRQASNRHKTVKQVIQLVKRWRELHFRQIGISRKRLNLQEAAKVIGIPKKSLDDYYCQLRLGQLYDFDFMKNLDEEIGVLRSYVKRFKPQRLQKERKNYAHHPKKLSILSLYDLDKHDVDDSKLYKKGRKQPVREHINNGSEPSLDKQISITNSESNGQENEELMGSNNEQSAGENQNILALEHDFFQGFRMARDDQLDPYFNQISLIQGEGIQNPDNINTFLLF